MRNDTTPPNPDHIPYKMASKALGVSRRTIERMIERGTLTRAEGAQVASVTRTSLAAAVEAANAMPTPGQEPATLVGAPLLAVLDQIRDANAAAMQANDELVDLRATMRLLEAAETANDELLNRLVEGSWRQRRQARREAIAKRKQT